MVCVRLSQESFAVVPVVSAPTVAPASPPTAVAEATTAEAPTRCATGPEAPTEIKRVA
jgi:hypothetical protein